MPLDTIRLVMKSPTILDATMIREHQEHAPIPITTMAGVILMQTSDRLWRIVVLLDSVIIMQEEDVPVCNVFQTQTFFTTVLRLGMLKMIMQDESMMSGQRSLDTTHIQQILGH